MKNWRHIFNPIQYFYCILHAGRYVLIRDDKFCNCLAVITLSFATRCHHAHTNISHRDKKPVSCIFTSQNQIKLLYFHVGRSSDMPDTLTDIQQDLSILLHFGKLRGGQSAGGCQRCKVPCCYNDWPAKRVWTKRAIRTLPAPIMAPAVVCFCQIEQRKQATGGAAERLLPGQPILYSWLNVAIYST